MKILLQESENSRIVQIKKWNLFGSSYKVARQRLINGRWKNTSELFTHQYKTVEDYQKYFDWDEKNEDCMGVKQF